MSQLAVMKEATDKFKQAQKLLDVLSWNLHNGVPVQKKSFRTSKTLDQLDQSATNCLKMAINDSLHDPVEAWNLTLRQDPYANYFYFLQHRRRLQAETSPEKSYWIIVSNQEVVFRGSTCAIVFDTMAQHSWPGAVAIDCNSPETLWVARQPRTRPEALDRRRFDAYDLFSGPWGGMKTNAPAPLYHCEMVSGLVGARWEKLACIMDRENRIVMTRTETEEWLHDEDTTLSGYEAQRKLCKAITEACDEEKDYTHKREWGRWKSSE